MSLSDAHRAYLSDEHAEYLAAAGIRPAQLTNVTSTPDGIRFELTGVTGRTLTQDRPDNPEPGAPKYRTEAGQPPVLIVWPGQEKRISDRKTTVVLCEGTKGSAAAAGNLPPGYAVLGMLGCYGWSSGHRPVEDLHALDLDGRDVTVILDADMTTNRQVYNAAAGLLEALTVTFGAASVRFVSPPGGGGTSVDDWISGIPDTGNRRTDAMRRLLANAKPLKALCPRPPAPKSYVKNGGPQVVAIHEALMEKHPMAAMPGERIAVYRNGVYSQDGFVRSVTQLLGDDFRDGHLKSIQTYSHARLSDEGREIPDRRNGNGWVNFTNGLVHADTGEARPHDPDLYTMYQVPYAYDPDATCPTYERWLTDAVGADQVDALEETAAQMLDPDTVPQYAGILIGETRSGKSTFLNIAGAVAGQRNTQALSLQQIASDRFAVAKLYGAVLNTFAELPASHMSEVSTFKAILGGDLLHGDNKYGKQFTFYNRALLLFSTNNVPTVGEDPAAYLARMRPTKFPISHLGREDRTLPARVMAEMPGILNRWLAALQRIRAEGFTPCSDEAVQELARETDQVRMWLSDSTHPGGVTMAANLYADYKVWADRNKRGVLGSKTFFQRLKSAGITAHRAKGGVTYPIGLGSKVHQGTPIRGEGVPSDAETGGKKLPLVSHLPNSEMLQKFLGEDTQGTPGALSPADSPTNPPVSAGVSSAAEPTPSITKVHGYVIPPTRIVQRHRNG